MAGKRKSQPEAASTAASAPAPEAADVAGAAAVASAAAVDGAAALAPSRGRKMYTQVEPAPLRHNHLICW